MRILIASQIAPEALATLQARHDVRIALGASEADLSAAAVDREAIVFRSGVSIGPGVLAAPDLRLLVRAGSGLDNLDLATVRERGIELVRIPGPGAQAVAELTFGLMIALARSIVLADRHLRNAHWAKSELVGYNLRGKRLGVVGLGSIGTRVATLGLAWGMRPIGVVAHPSEERARSFAAQGVDLADLERVLEESDFISLHVPLDVATRGMIGADQLARVKPGAFLVNIARGGVVDEAALLGALQPGGRLRGAALDVHVAEGEGRRSPLADLPNVVLTPHIGAQTIDAQEEIGREVVAIIDRFDAATREEPMSPQLTSTRE
ncbi:MAG TPA: NAD(P)-dependent oxidoreductase [Candidatus Limnocylindrales bacterium]|nr:NAD(P)-dependent oxidoreductase [Candidatus Limnocylindrales bacterium]